MSLSTGFSAATFAVMYYAVVYGVLILFGTPKDRLFRYASLPLAAIGVVWIGWALIYNGWGGMVIAVMLLAATGLAWVVKRVI